MLVFIVFTLLSAIWGSTWLFIKVGLGDLPPFWFASGRFIIALIPLLILALWRRKPLPRNPRDWTITAITGFLIFGTNYGLVFWGENYISSGLAAILYTFLPLFGMVISHFYRRTEIFTFTKLIGISLGIFGIAIIFRHQLILANGDALWGSLAILLAALGTAFGGVLVKVHAIHLDTINLTTGQVIAGLIPLVIAALVLEPIPDVTSLPGKAWFGLAYLGLMGSALTFVLFNWLIKRIAITTTQLIPFASTLLAVWLGALFLNEPLHPGTTLGGGLVLTGLLIATRPRRPRTGSEANCPVVNTGQTAD